jgi:hypothetical protein
MFLGCDAVYPGSLLPMFRKNLLPPSFRHLEDSTRGTRNLIYSEDWGSKLLRSVGNESIGAQVDKFQKAVGLIFTVTEVKTSNFTSRPRINNCKMHVVNFSQNYGLSGRGIIH